MKIAYLNPSGSLGGAESCLLDILASLRAAEPGWSLRLIVGSDGPLVSRAEQLGVPTKVVPFPRALATLGDAGFAGTNGDRRGRLHLAARLFYATPGVLAYVRQLRRALHELAPDLVHTNGFKMHVLAAWARPAGVPVIWHIHDYVGPRPVMAHLLRWYAGRCAAAVANSRSVAADVESVCGRGHKICTVPNAIDLARFSPEGPKLNLDALAGLSPASKETVRVGLLGTFAWWKGHKTFLQALSLLPPSLPIRGYVIGGPVYQTGDSQQSLSHLRSLTAQLKLSDKVGFTGFVEDPASAMRALDIIVHASSQPEPFGLVIVEAMACGRALIASPTGGAAEILELGKNALGHPPGNAVALAERIAELASNPELRARLGRAGRVTSESRYDRSRLASDLIPIYRKVLSSPLAV
jgi:glycosyltransferase involved in cell wall biosynthesis